MITVNGVAQLVFGGATYDNLEAIRKVGARWDNGARSWILNVERHPLNNTKQAKKLETMLNALEENGVRFIIYWKDGGTGECPPTSPSTRRRTSAGRSGT